MVAEIGFYVADPPDSNDPYPSDFVFTATLPLRWKVDTWAAQAFNVVLDGAQRRTWRANQKRFRKVGKRVEQLLTRAGLDRAHRAAHHEIKNQVGFENWLDYRSGEPWRIPTTQMLRTILDDIMLEQFAHDEPRSRTRAYRVLAGRICEVWTVCESSLEQPLPIREFRELWGRKVRRSMRPTDRLEVLVDRIKKIDQRQGQPRAFFR